DVELQPEMHDGLRDLWPDAADDAVGAHESSSRYGLDQMLSHQGIDGWHAGDVDDGDLGSRLDDVIEQILHHGLSTLAVQRADQGQGQDLVPQFHHRGGKLQQLPRLAFDDFVAAALIDFCRVKTKLVDQLGRGPNLLAQLLRVALDLLA